MRVKFLTVSAGPGGVIRPGDVIEVSEGEAKLLIDGGYAEALGKPTVKATHKKEQKRK